jgi:hypothetical protein
MSGSRFCTSSTSSATPRGSCRRSSTAHVSHILLASSVIDFLRFFYGRPLREREQTSRIAGASAGQDSVHVTMTSSISVNSCAHNPLRGSHCSITSYAIVSDRGHHQKRALCTCIFTRFAHRKRRSSADFFPRVTENAACEIARNWKKSGALRACICASHCLIRDRRVCSVQRQGTRLDASAGG